MLLFRRKAETKKHSRHSSLTPKLVIKYHGPPAKSTKKSTVSVKTSRLKRLLVEPKLLSLSWHSQAFALGNRQFPCCFGPGVPLQSAASTEQKQAGLATLLPVLSLRRRILIPGRPTMPGG
jgi:hypothetical protein